MKANLGTQFIYWDEQWGGRQLYIQLNSGEGEVWRCKASFIFAFSLYLDVASWVFSDLKDEWKIKNFPNRNSPGQSDQSLFRKDFGAARALFHLCPGYECPPVEGWGGHYKWDQAKAVEANIFACLVERPLNCPYHVPLNIIPSVHVQT